MPQKTALNQALRVLKNRTYPNRILKHWKNGKYSQLGQDLFVIRHLRHKRNGFFVEVGVGEGKHLSNTYLLEKKYKWNGILCEPNPVFHDSIRAQRSAILEKRAAFSESGARLSFLCCQNRELSTFSMHANGDHHVGTGTEIDVETVTLTDLLTQQGVKEIDYLSVDTEGSELAILKDFDFDRFKVPVMTIEHNFDKERLAALDFLILPRGYERVHADRSQFDAWYVRQGG
jgi:FkbM family methyltransferase